MSERGTGVGFDTSGLPEGLLEAVEHVVRRMLRETVALPTQGVVIRVNTERDTFDVRPLYDKPVIRNIPCTVARYSDPDKSRDGGEPRTGLVMRPKVGSKVLVGFVDGVYDLPVLLSAERVGEVLINAEVFVKVHSRGYLQITADGPLSLNGRAVLPVRDNI